MQACLEAGDRLLGDNPLTLERYAGMNDRVHALILNACGIRMISGGFEAVVEVNNADSQSRLATSTA